MKNYIQPGDVLNHVAASAIDSGDVVVMGQRIGIAMADIAQNATGAVAVSGVFELPVVTAGAIAQGALVYWDVADGEINASSGGNIPAGYAAKAKVSGNTTILVNLNA
jgi:predicted RecA/RadA family phage recombinase